MLSSNSEIISLIESRIGQLHVDAIDRRKMNIPIVVQEEAGFVMLFAGSSYYNLLLAISCNKSYVTFFFRITR